MLVIGLLPLLGLVICILLALVVLFIFLVIWWRIIQLLAITIIDVRAVAWLFFRIILEISL